MPIRPASTPARRDSADRASTMESDVLADGEAVTRRFETLKQEIAAHATAEKVAELKAANAHALPGACLRGGRSLSERRRRRPPS